MASQSQRAVLSLCCRCSRDAAVVGVHGPVIVLRVLSDAWLELTHIAVLHCCHAAAVVGRVSCLVPG
mgnify:CR=1 FL=1